MQKQELQTRLEEARGHRELAILEMETALVSEEARILNLDSSLVMAEAFGDFIDPRTPYTDTPGFGSAYGKLSQVRPLDRVRGDFPPHFSSEGEWRAILAQVRHLSDTDEMAISALDNLTNYAVNVGYTREVQPAMDSDAPAGLVELCKDILKAADLESKICCKWERDRFRNRRLDGETLTSYERTAEGTWRLTMLPTDNLTEPSPSDARVIESFWGFPAADWNYGIATDRRTRQVHGYFFQWGEGREEWSFYPAALILHSKLNTPPTVKRGLSDLFCSHGRLRRAATLANNTLIGSTKLASIALIRKQAGKQGGAVRLGHTASLSHTNSTGEKKDYFYESADGSVVIDTKDSVDYQAGPVGNRNAPDYIAVGKDNIRIAMKRWQMPAWMATGDGDLVNHASSLTTEAPFTRSNQGRQRDESDERQEMYWRILDAESQPGGVIWGKYRDFAPSLRSFVDVKIEPPDMSAHDTLKDAQENAILKQNEVISIQTWREMRGIDHEVEEGRVSEERDAKADELKAATAVVNQNIATAAEESWEEYA